MHSNISLITCLKPTYANLFMACVDIWFANSGIDEITLENFIIFLKRFIDDYLIFWTGSEEQLLTFMTKINSMHLLDIC